MGPTMRYQTAAEHDQLMAARTELLAVLTEATKHRPERQTIVTDGDSQSVGWVVYEREQMLAGVNRIRARHGLEPVTAADVARVELCACGHIDYGSKYALYCAELAVAN